ncbi:uncharacterized protein L201_002153 [Kwoniella dendrophila CBS 6074]|uniref:N-acetyltransferase domain-containing protein n=1 Tax=Kwoniella dendrophila CBS 6074 TaxID=1295534 RepID=A0AAX4JPE4_9TREE
MTINPSQPEPSHANISTPVLTPTTNKPCTIPHTFRIGCPSDSLIISELLREVFTQTFSFDLTQEDLDDYLNTTLTNEQIKSDIEDPNSIWILALSSASGKEEEEELLGIIQLKFNSFKDCLTLNENPIELHRIYLSTKTHGKGLSQSILSYTQNLAISKGYKSIWLGVYSKHPQGIKFYEKSGFVKCGERIFVVGEDKQVDWVMEKPLI